MISNAKKIPLDKVSKHFFSRRKIFFLQQKHFSYCKKRILGQEKKNCCHFIKRNFLGIRKKLCEWRE